MLPHLKEKLVRDFGDQDSNSEFLQLLLKKCFFNIFGSEHVSCILNQLSSDLSGNETFKDSSMKLLLLSSAPAPTDSYVQELTKKIRQEVAVEVEAKVNQKVCAEVDGKINRKVQDNLTLANGPSS
ncbi:hypothetical protein POM88_050359 [Heracleum sosnowskyi]|uniref:Uncharacterized protein n=1 Tax=Heracleum sosnowskyi TaxID=360622 RepID=A0AAD8GZX2_9APIA|nr:hypothetical protein POM88_050359 [Heracleum sosnowskyi]